MCHSIYMKDEDMCLSLISYITSKTSVMSVNRVKIVSFSFVK